MAVHEKGLAQAYRAWQSEMAGQANRRSPKLEFWQPPDKWPELILPLGRQRGPLQLWIYLGRQEAQQEVEVVDPKRICDDVEACSI